MSSDNVPAVDAPAVDAPAVEVTNAEPGSDSGAGRPKVDGVYPVPEGGIPSLPLDPPFIPGQHKMLKPSDFKDDADYNQWKGGYYIAKGEKMVKLAAELRKLGDVETRKAASRLAKISEETERLIAQLTAAGVDPKAALAAILGNI